MMRSEVEDRVTSRLASRCARQVEGIIVGDQMPHDNWGVVTDRVRSEICQLAEEFPDKLFFVDSRTRIGKYHHVTVKPNRFEAKRAVDPEWTGGEVDIEEAKRCGEILTEADGKATFCNCWSEGHLGISRWTG